MLNPLHTSNHVEEIHLLRSSHGIVYNRNHQILVVPFCKDILWWHKPLHQHLPGCRAEKLVEILFLSQKNCHNNKRPNVFKGSYLGKTPTKGCSHSDWEYILMPTQSFLLMAEILRSPVEVGRKYPIIYRVLYIPGGDRQISEPSTDIQP